MPLSWEEKDLEPGVNFLEHQQAHPHPESSSLIGLCDSRLPNHVGSVPAQLGGVAAHAQSGTRRVPRCPRVWQRARCRAVLVGLGAKVAGPRWDRATPSRRVTRKKRQSCLRCPVTKPSPLSAGLGCRAHPTVYGDSVGCEPQSPSLGRPQGRANGAGPGENRSGAEWVGPHRLKRGRRSIIPEAPPPPPGPRGSGSRPVRRQPSPWEARLPRVCV